MPRAAILTRRDAGGGLLLVGLDPGESDAASYREPGQYLEVRAPSEHGFFVLASAVGVRPWELLVRNTGDAADLLASTPIGGAIEVSAPLGRGFPRESLRGRPLIVAVVASAVGVARALAAARRDDEEASRTTVLVGVRAAVDVPLATEVEAWIAAGIAVQLCLSRSELEHHRDAIPGAARAAGYVQTVLGRMQAQGLVPEGAVVAAAGPEGMLADLGALHGIEVLTNTG